MILRDLSVGYRLGITGLVISLLIGLWASVGYLGQHHQNRDQKPGVSVDDLLGAYHGVDNQAPLLTALERGHPEELPDSDRELLLTWLRGDRVSEEYDDPDLGDVTPAEILDASCLSCHSRQATEGDGIGETYPLDYWDDVQKIAFSRHLDPVPEEILLVSTHTHAISLGVLSLVVLFLLHATRWPGAMCGALAAVCGLGLLADLASWWITRTQPGFIYVIIVGGALWAASIAISCVAVVLDLWLPRRSP